MFQSNQTLLKWHFPYKQKQSKKEVHKNQASNQSTTCLYQLTLVHLLCPFIIHLYTISKVDGEIKIANVRPGSEAAAQESLFARGGKTGMELSRMLPLSISLPEGPHADRNLREEPVAHGCSQALQSFWESQQRQGIPVLSDWMCPEWEVGGVCGCIGPSWKTQQHTPEDSTLEGAPTALGGARTNRDCTLELMEDFIYLCIFNHCTEFFYSIS